MNIWIYIDIILNLIKTNMIERFLTMIGPANYTNISKKLPNELITYINDDTKISYHRFFSFFTSKNVS